MRAVVSGPDGVLAGAKPGAVVAIHSTILPATAIELAKAAPRSVSRCSTPASPAARTRARQKQLTYIVGGDADALEKARPFLENSSVKIIHAGALGDGASSSSAST